jgi:hypothetical protein
LSILSDFEDRVGGALEGAFAGMFRSPVQPVEIAKALGRAMDDGRTIGVGRVYAPLAYTVALSPEDAAKYGSFTATLAGELSTYLTGQARERNYQLTSPPKIFFIVHDDLRLGRFRVSAELGAPGTETEAETSSRAVAEDVESWPEEPRSPADDLATVTVGDHEHDVLLRGERVLVGRLAGCAICLSDANVSREHAAFVPVSGDWAIEDLGSTNGTLLNGEPVARALLHDGDLIEIGLSRLTFHEPRR